MKTQGFHRLTKKLDKLKMGVMAVNSLTASALNKCESGACMMKGFIEYENKCTPKNALNGEEKRTEKFSLVR